MIHVSKTSQFGEDDHIEAVFDEIGYGSCVLLDIGARLTYSNSRNLIDKHGFTGVLVEGNRESADELSRTFPGLSVVCKVLKPEDVNSVCPPACWFFSLDVDSNDWWFWANLQQKPALVVVETNPLEGLFIAPMATGQKDRNGYGMSVCAATALAKMKGYEYIGRTEVNAFYVRKDLGCKYRLPPMTAHRGLPCKAENNVL